MKKELSVKWFDVWHSALDEALAVLPEMDGCPNELFKSLAQNGLGVTKRVALVTKKDVPVAVVGVKKRADSWAPVTHYLVPGCLFPMNEAYLGSILDALDINLWVSWWRNKTPIPTFRNLRKVETIPTYRLDLTGDYESQWTKKQRKNVRAALNRCQEFNFVVDPPKSAEWVIKNCNRKWSEDPDALDRNLSDQLITANYLQKINRLHAPILMDKGEFIAGSTLIVHDDDLVGTFIYRMPDYDKYGIGSCLMVLIFSWAKNAGFNGVDIGGDYSDYKQHWAPQDGEKTNINVCPTRLMLSKRVRSALDRVEKKTKLTLGLHEEA
ncbi:GNAT family N-acetyltransferase [candidate division KSB1 bacterium]|nr:GNAT family N-acetyltransferase [candidate division KSB1 bacterium]